MSKIILIRHGESLANVDGKYYKCHDSANILTQKGVDQCLALQPMVRTLVHDFYGVGTTILCSKYQRAKLTSQIVMGNSPIPIIEDQRLNECEYDANGPCESHGNIINRIRTVLDQYPFNIIMFTHGVLIGALTNDTHTPNCVVREYDRERFIKYFL